MLALSVRHPFNIYYWLIGISLVYIAILSWVLRSLSMTESAHHIHQQQENTLSVYQVVFSPPQQSTVVPESIDKIEPQDTAIVLPSAEKGEFIEAPKKLPEKPKEKPIPIKPITPVKKQAAQEKVEPIKQRDLESQIAQTTSEASAESVTQHMASSLAGSSRALSEKGIGQGESDNHYISSLRREIERHKRYPSQARRMQHEGHVVVSFSLTSEGAVSKVEIENTSGISSLDNAAIAAVKRVKSIGPKPESVLNPLIVSLDFQLN
ncbi:energy transducer TonB [Proteus alimentorum]|uniref:Protein TonB n=1 Tax=Proteus alimentorum TaxID=1973495 RepID=A0ABS0IRY9_9GAMM|nr:energy transducer TonB [Proteus alimentorum]MBG2875425.1 energy transducer TonB [Proteus alimentorum]MBG2878390.1 energy transducer TonB [Proteus alimentorum]